MFMRLSWELFGRKHPNERHALPAVIAVIDQSAPIALPLHC